MNYFFPQGCTKFKVLSVFVLQDHFTDNFKIKRNQFWARPQEFAGHGPCPCQRGLPAHHSLPAFCVECLARWSQLGSLT